MSFSKEQGYLPVSLATIMDNIMVNFNTQFSTNYTTQSFQGTNAYKFYYAIAQELQKNEALTADVFLNLQQYIILTNQKISRPVNTNPGIVDKFLEEGYVASVKPMILADAGKINIAVDVDDGAGDYAATKTAIASLISQITVGGTVTEGGQSETIVLSNGQSFDFKFHLPNEIPIILRLTTTLSENNQVLVGSPEDVKLKLFTNINSRYRLGLNFEPQKYYNIQDDAPWTSDVTLEWSDDAGSTWNSTVFDADFDDLFTFALDDITLVES